MLRRSAVTVAVLSAAVVALPGIAQANYSATGSGSATLGAMTIRNASGLTSACVSNPGADDVTLSWTASPDSAIVSYVIDRVATGGAPNASLPSAKGTISLTDSNTYTGASAYTYTYTIRAVVGTAPWTTTVSASTTRTFTKTGKCS